MHGLYLASIPSPSSPLIAEIGPFKLRWYGTLIALGILIAGWLTERQMARRGLDPEKAYTVAAWCVPGGIIGARLYHIATDWELFSGHLERLPQIWNGGLGLPGVLIGGTIGATIGARRAGLPVLWMYDCIAPGLVLAQALGRWGNYFNQELFGRPTDLPWALEIDPQHRPARYATSPTFQPTFLYESLWNLLVFTLLMLVSRRAWRRLAPGTVFALYLTLYAFARFFIEGLRSDYAHTIGGIRVNQWLFGIVFVGALLWLVRSRGRPGPQLTSGGGVEDLEALERHEHAHLDSAEG